MSSQREAKLRLSATGTGLFDNIAWNPPTRPISPNAMGNRILDRPEQYLLPHELNNAYNQQRAVNQLVQREFANRNLPFPASGSAYEILARGPMSAEEFRMAQSARNPTHSSVTGATTSIQPPHQSAGYTGMPSTGARPPSPVRRPLSARPSSPVRQPPSSIRGRPPLPTQPHSSMGSLTAAPVRALNLMSSRSSSSLQSRSVTTSSTASLSRRPPNLLGVRPPSLDSRDAGALNIRPPRASSMPRRPPVTMAPIRGAAFTTEGKQNVGTYFSEGLKVYPFEKIASEIKPVWQHYFSSKENILSIYDMQAATDGFRREPEEVRLRFAIRLWVEDYYPLWLTLTKMGYSNEQAAMATQVPSLEGFGDIEAAPTTPSGSGSRSRTSSVSAENFDRFLAAHPSLQDARGRSMM